MRLKEVRRCLLSSKLLVPKADGTMPDYKNQSLYEGWKVIRVGTDAADDFCGGLRPCNVGSIHERKAPGPCAGGGRRQKLSG